MRARVTFAICLGGQGCPGHGLMNGVGMPVAADKQSTVLAAWNDAATGSWRLSPRPHRGEPSPVERPSTQRIGEARTLRQPPERTVGRPRPRHLFESSHRP